MTFRFCDDLGADGFSWIAEERMTRTSHALAAAGKVWLVDPVDWPEAIERVASLGRPEAVLQLLDRHNRDSAAIAERLGVPHLVVPASLPQTPFEVIEVKRWRRWQEIALWDAGRRTLVVAEALGANAFFTLGDDPVGVHGLLKLTPPRMLAQYEPEHLLLGHGEGVHGPEAADALRRALSRSRLTFFTWGATLPFRARKGA
jgi:sugar phosphate isomerase/epimerase